MQNNFKTYLMMTSWGRNMRLYWYFIKRSCVQWSFFYFFLYRATHNGIHNFKIIAWWWPRDIRHINILIFVKSCVRWSFFISFFIVQQKLDAQFKKIRMLFVTKMHTFFNDFEWNLNIIKYCMCIVLLTGFKCSPYWRVKHSFPS